MSTSECGYVSMKLDSQKQTTDSQTQEVDWRLAGTGSVTAERRGASVWEQKFRVHSNVKTPNELRAPKMIKTARSSVCACMHLHIGLGVIP